MKNGQSDRLTSQQRQGQGPVTIFHKDAQVHDKEVWETSIVVKQELEKKYPTLTFRYRRDLTKKEINDSLRAIDSYLGQTLFVNSALIRPDGGLIEVQDDNGKWRVVLVSEAKHQGKDIENILSGTLVGKNKDQDIMAAGNAIERAYKNINEISNFMLSENYFPYILFLEGSNFLTQTVVVKRPDGRQVTLQYNDGLINRIDRLTAANYGMPINTNLCRNKTITHNGTSTSLQAVSLYTNGKGGHWHEEDMKEIMLDVAQTSLKMLASDLFDQISSNKTN